MARRTSLAVEGLEERALLSSLAYSLTTDQSNYQVGQPIEITFTETNTGDQPLTVALSPTDLSVSQNNKVIWQSDPTNANQPPTSETLLPGQSVSQTASWDGTETYASPSPTIGGSSQGSQVNAFGSFVVSNPNAPNGLTAPFQITDPMVSTVTTDQPVYQLGEPIQLTYTDVNSSDQSITIPRPQPAGFGITHNGTPVMLDLVPAIYIFGTETVAPGQVFTQSQTWNGIPTFGDFTPGELTGTYVATYGPTSNDTQATTTFQIVAPSPDELATSVTTDQTTYQPGQPVNMTFTETNVGTQPIAVLTGSTEFLITQNGSASFGGSVNPGGPDIQEPTWLTLQPGQSYSQTETWSGVPNLLTSSGISLAAPFTVSNEYDPNADTATFQYAAPPTSVLQTSVTTDQSIYQLGQPIQFNFTETNVGTTPIQVWEGPSGFDVKQNGNEVWNSLVPDLYPYQWDLGNYGWVTLQPGQSYTQTETWNGVPDQLPSAYPSGTFTVSNELDPRADTATFQIVAPTTANTLTSTITTDKTVYDLGAPAQLTFTETNTGNKPVSVLTGPSAFQVTGNGTVLWASTAVQDLSPLTTWQTLQPDQSYSQTILWDTSVGAGSFVVSDLLDPNGSSTTIQVLPDESLSIPPPSNFIPPTPPLSNPPPSVPTPDLPLPPSVPPIAVTLSTAPTYKLGQSVPLSLVLKDTSASKVTINETRHIETVTVEHGSTVVYESARKANRLTSRILKSGHSLKLTTLWSGKPNQSAVKKLLPGIYTITVDHDGYAASTTVDLVSHRK